ncbi:nucleotide exchange factor GrpE [Patescibacteria group bacterium]
MKKSISPKGGTKKQPTSTNDSLKRALADYQNLKKRVESEKHDFIKFATASVLDKFLSVLDDLERAQTHLKDDGLKLTIDQFKSVLKTEGVEELDVLNKPFDPASADCAEIIAGKKNINLQVIQKGYSLHGKILRPAKVKVGKGEK